MIYQFRCVFEDCEAYGVVFEIDQPMQEKHIAYCPVCLGEAQRVYSILPFQFGKADYNRNGSRDLNPDLPHVPTGTKFTHGFTPNKERTAGN